MFSSWTLPRFFRILMIEQRVKKLFFANIFLVFFSWAKLDGTGGLVASDCVKLCVCVSMEHVEQLNRAGSSCC